MSIDHSKLHVRWMIRRDMPEILEIEPLCFEYAWSEEDFIRCLKLRNCIGMVADMDDRVLGYMIYELSKTALEVLNFAVLPSVQRMGVGRRMHEKLASKIGYGSRSRIIAEVRETNLDALLFFKAMGYRAVRVLRESLKETGEDEIVMQWRKPKQAAANATSAEELAT